MRHILTAVFGMALAGSVIAADQAPTITTSEPTPQVGTSADHGYPTGMHWSDDGHASAHGFDHGVDAGAQQDANVGKEASPESADSVFDRQGRANALSFNRSEEQDSAMSGSSAGMEPGEQAESAGKPADRRDYDPVDQGRANALMFNQHERELDDRSQGMEESHQDHAD